MKRNWRIFIIIFVLLTTVNLFGVFNYENLLNRDYASKSDGYILVLLVFDHHFGRYTGIFIWQILAFIFLYIGIRKIIKFRRENKQIS